MVYSTQPAVKGARGCLAADFGKTFLSVCDTRSWRSWGGSELAALELTKDAAMDAVSLGVRAGKTCWKDQNKPCFRPPACPKLSVV